MSAKNGKPCKKCGVNEWNKRGGCAACARERAKRCYAENPDKKLERDKQYRATNSDKVRERNKRYKAANSDKIREEKKRHRIANLDRERERVKRWKAENRDKVRDDNKRWAAANPDKVRENAKRWESENPDRVRENAKRWHAANPDKKRAYKNNRRTRKTKAGGSFTASEWKQLCAQYGNRCLKCGEVKPLTADHIIPVSMGGTSDISNIQPLCQSCNSTKGTATTDYRNKPLAERWKTRSIFEMIDVPI